MTVRSGAAVALAAGLWGGCAAPPPPPAPPVPARFAVVRDSQLTAVAAAVVTPGSAWELTGTEGLTFLAARAALAQVRPALAGFGARAYVQCTPAAFTFTLVAPPAEWRMAVRVFLDALFRPDVGKAALERARAELVATLSLDGLSPAWQSRLAERRSLWADSVDSGWDGPACGTPETVAIFTPLNVRAALERFRPGTAFAALLGPVDDSAVALLRSRLGTRPAPPLPAPRRVVPERRYVERNTVTAWVSLAFPFGPDADEEAIRLVGALLEDAVRPDVARPDVFDAGTELIRHGEGGALVVHAVTEPAAAGRYLALIRARAAEVAAGKLPRPVFERVRRRQLGRRLREAALPEARAAAIALRLALGGPGAADDGWPALSRLTPERVRAAAAALGRPATSVVGPRASAGESQAQ